MHFNAVISDFEKLRNNLGNITNLSAEEKKEELLDVNRNQLFDNGIDANGNRIYPDYRAYTIEMKDVRNRFESTRWRNYHYEPTDHVALIQAGNFYKAFYFIYRMNEMLIWSGDGKTGKLVGKYGRDIFGIAPENMQEFLLILMPVIWRRINSLTREYRK